MRRLLALALLPAFSASVLAAGCSDATGPASCTREDETLQRPPSSKAVYQNGAWHVTLYQVRKVQEEYVENGHQCTRTVYKQFGEKHCYFAGPKSMMTEAEAIAACRG